MNAHVERHVAGVPRTHSHGSVYPSVSTLLAGFEELHVSPTRRLLPQRREVVEIPESLRSLLERSGGEAADIIRSNLK